MSKIVLIFFTIIVVCACKSNQVNKQINPNDISLVITNMTDIMVNDVTNPPLAARFFAYTCLAGYEVIAQNDSSYMTMAGKLKNYPLLQKPDSIKGYNYQLSAILAMIETAKKLQPSGVLLEKFELFFIDSLTKAGFSNNLIQQSLNYAKAISKEILIYAKADSYHKISNYKRYAPLTGDGFWYPTPPGYFAPVEPFFNTIRPLTLDTANQFKPVSPIPFSTNKSSAFYKLMNNVYTTTKSALKEQMEIASFWDCNPFAVDNNGHLLIAKKKISPGAHWMGITGIACKQANISFEKAMQINAVVAIGLMDGFIACWDEKFRSNRIRPETAIRKYIDPNWQPLLQTPPFPEYLSGHSVASATSATILTHFLGNNFRYADTVEVRFGIPKRSFNSFNEAALEASISRLYGGIHFTDALDNGRLQGEQVGKWVIKKLMTK